MIKLCVDARPFARGTGGISRYIQEILLYIGRNPEFEIILYADTKELNLPSSIKYRQLRVVPISKKFWHLFVWHWTRIDNPDIYWSPRHHLPLFFKAKKTALTIHDLVWATHPKTMPFAKYLNELCLMPSGIKRSDVLISVSKTTKAQIERKFNVDVSKTTVIYNGADALKPNTESPPAKPSNITKNPFILSVGTLEPRKNYVTLITAMEEYWAQGGSRDLIIAGKRGWKFKNIFNAQKTSHHKDRIHILTQVDDTELAALYYYADAKISSSLAEGFGLPVIEACHFDKPLLLSNIEIYRELFPHCKYWFNPDESASITSSLFEFENNEKCSERNVDTANLTALHSWEASARQHIEVFKHLINKDALDYAATKTYLESFLKNNSQNAIDQGSIEQRTAKLLFDIAVFEPPSNRKHDKTPFLTLYDHLTSFEKKSSLAPLKHGIIPKHLETKLEIHDYAHVHKTDEVHYFTQLATENLDFTIPIGAESNTQFQIPDHSLVPGALHTSNLEVICNHSDQICYQKNSHQVSVFCEASVGNIGLNLLRQELQNQEIKLTGTTLVITGLTVQKNYYHWLIDVLPRFYLAKVSGWQWDQILLNDIDFDSPHLESLRLLNIDPKTIIKNNTTNHFSLEHAIVPLPVSGLTNQQFLPKFPLEKSGSKASRIQPWVVNFLKKLILETPRVDQTDELSFPKRLYIARKNGRSIANFSEIEKILVSYNFETIYLEDYNLAIQAQLFNRAEFIIAPHGAGLANLVFAEPRTPVIEIFNGNFINSCYWQLANQAELNYECIITNSGSKNTTDADLLVDPNFSKSQIYVDPSLLKEKIRSLSSTTRKTNTL
jgi:glycosyltransferase involved in cell wall biosynthesis/capsular polysaccharide biosynthesis protein